LAFKVENTKLIDGAKLIGDVKYKEEGGKEKEVSVEGGAEYTMAGAAFSGSAIYDKKGVNGKLSGAFHTDPFSIGALVGFPIQSTEAITLDGKLAYNFPGFTGHVFSENWLSKIGAGWTHKINSETTWAARVTVVRKGEASQVNKPFLELVLQRQLDAATTVKAYVNSDFSVRLAKLIKLNSNTTLTLGANADPINAKVEAVKIGLSYDY